MNAVICMPWRGGAPSRERVQRQIVAHYEAMGFPVFLGDSDPALPFNRPAARNAAAAGAGDAEVYVFLDADAYVPFPQVTQAIEFASASGGAALPYERIKEMNPVTGETRERVQLGVSPVVVSANVAVALPLWQRMHGWDERLCNWGWEDGAFLRAIRVLGAVLDSVPGTLISIDHERAATEEPVTILASRQRPVILDAYDAARTPEEMQAVLDLAWYTRTQSGTNPPQVAGVSGSKGRT